MFTKGFFCVISEHFWKGNIDTKTTIVEQFCSLKGHKKEIRKAHVPLVLINIESKNTQHVGNRKELRRQSIWNPKVSYGQNVLTNNGNFTEKFGQASVRAIFNSGSHRLFYPTLLLLISTAFFDEFASWKLKTPFLLNSQLDMSCIALLLLFFA